MSLPQINNTIHQAGDFRLAEMPAGGTITPGMLIKENSTNQMVVHATAGGFAELSIALEDALQGRTTADNYVTGDPVQVGFEKSGNIVMLLCAPTYNYTIGTQLISNGDGTLKPTTGSPSQIIATVILALNISASGSAATLVQCRIN